MKNNSTVQNMRTSNVQFSNNFILEGTLLIKPYCYVSFIFVHIRSLSLFLQVSPFKIIFIYISFFKEVTKYYDNHSIAIRRI